MSQTSVAQQAGLDVRQVSALVRGQANPTYITLLRLCDGLEIPLSRLIERVEELEVNAADPGGSRAAVER